VKRPFPFKAGDLQQDTVEQWRMVTLEISFELQEAAFNGLQREERALSSAGADGTGFQRAFAVERPLAGVRGWSSRERYRDHLYYGAAGSFRLL